MAMESGLGRDRQLQNSQDFEKARCFMTKRRMEILCALYRNNRLSQGELAQESHSRPTALSNILLKVESFSPRLIEKEYEGKFCYYTLSDWGRRFISEYVEAGSSQIQEDSIVQDHEDDFLFRAAKESLAELKHEYGDMWYTVFDDVLTYYTRSVRQVPDKGQRLLVNRYLRSLELLRLHQNDRLGNQTLALLTEYVHRQRVAEYMDSFFQPFVIVLKSLPDKEHLFGINTILEHIFSGCLDEIAETAAKDVGWDKQAFQELIETVKRVRACFQGHTAEEIYDYFTALLPDQDMLSFLISRWMQNCQESAE